MLTRKNLLEGLKGFVTSDISYCRRSQNNVADHLTKMNYPEFTGLDSYLPPMAFELSMKEKMKASSNIANLEDGGEVNSFNQNHPSHEADPPFFQFL